MEPVFYENGLKFECTRCNDCCRHDPGYVFLSAADINRLCDGLGLSIAELTVKYLREISIGGFKRVSLTEKENFDCIFWEKGGCLVYAHRPLQCKTYPFWPSSLAGKDSWESTARSCPGIGKGRKYSRREIEHLLDLRKKEPFISLP